MTDKTKGRTKIALLLCVLGYQQCAICDAEATAARARDVADAANANASNAIYKLQNLEDR